MNLCVYTVYIYKLYCVSIWICIHLWTSSCFEREKFATSLLTTFHVGNFAERNILRSSQRSLRPKSRGHKRLHSVPSDTELLTHYATLPELGREVRSKTLGETCWNGNTTEESFSMWTVMMAPRLKTAEVQPSTLAKFVEPFFLVWNSMDAHDFVLEHFAENAIHPRKDHWWFGLKQITRYSAHGTTWGSSKNRTYSVHGHGYFNAETHFLIHWNREAHFSDKAINNSNSTYFQLRWVPQERNVVLTWQQTQLSDLIPWNLDDSSFLV